MTGYRLRAGTASFARIAEFCRCAVMDGRWCYQRCGLDEEFGTLSRRTAIARKVTGRWTAMVAR